MTHCYLSVDLEDYKHATMRDMGLAPLTNPEQTARGVERILSALRRVPGADTITFFTTGQIARDQADLVTTLSRQGHEIGCHTDQHENIFDLDQRAFEYNVRRAVESLVNASGKPVVGFRAPNFSIDARCHWAYGVLARGGFLYDSSVVHGGRRAAGVEYDIIETTDGRLCEFPVYYQRVFRGFGVRVIGGTYFRVLPLPIILRLMHNAVACGYVPVIYLHPADLDDRFDRISLREMRALSMASRLKWLAHQQQWSAGTRGALAKLEALLKIFPNKGVMRQAVSNGTPA